MGAGNQLTQSSARVYEAADAAAGVWEYEAAGAVPSLAE